MFRALVNASVCWSVVETPNDEADARLTPNSQLPTFMFSGVQHALRRLRTTETRTGLRLRHALRSYRFRTRPQAQLARQRQACRMAGA